MEGRSILAILSGLLSLLSFPPFNFGWLGFVALIPLFSQLYAAQTKWKSFLVGALYGAVFMGGFHFWITELRVFSNWNEVLALWGGYTLYLSLFYGAAGLLFYYGRRFVRLPILFPSIWVVCEWLRSIGPLGNSAGALGYSANPLLIQYASIVGVFGLSFFIAWVNVKLLMLLRTPFQLANRAIWGFISIFVLVHSVGLIQSSLFSKSLTPNPVPTLDVAIIQGNHSQQSKLRAKAHYRIMQDYLSASRAEEPGKLLFWPETVIPRNILAYTHWRDDITALSKQKQSHILFGTVSKGSKGPYNSVALLSPTQGNQYYHKEVLMPFGEYLPFRSLFEHFGIASFLLESADYLRGRNSSLLSINHPHSKRLVPIGAGICLESIYPWHYRNQSKEGAQFLSVFVNNAWFAHSSAAKKHLQMSRMRAVENRRVMVQSANTGISAIISANGTLVKTIALDSKGSIAYSIPLYMKQSIYTRYGDYIVWFSIIMVCLGLVPSKIILRQRHR